MDFISDASYIKPIGTPRYRYDSSFFKYGISPFWTTNWNSETLDGYFLEHVKQRVAHLSCRNERFSTFTAIDTSDRRSCSPCLVRLMITRSSAYAKMDIGWLWILKGMLGFSSHFEMMHLISNSDVRLNRTGVMGHLCLTPALMLIGGVSSSCDVLTTVVLSVYMSLIKSINKLEKPI